MLLKVCGMRDVENMRGLEEEVRPDYMGMIFYPPSPRYVESKNSEDYATIQLPKVGVFVNEPVDKVLETIELFGLNGVQLHGRESMQYIEELREKSEVFVWKVWSVKDNLDWDALALVEPVVDAFLFDTFTEAHGGSGKVFNWQILETYPFSTPFFLSGGLGQEHAAAIRELKERIPQLVGVDLNSKFEISPGFKDIKRLVAFKNSLVNTEINEGSR
ncbi:phosphoribosylanthranilate isomerase [Mongoliitalea daihaiensis]|uniref:phosphoribosylanthranilate isomerase n=1 Tax=Mongoliitalea daihaiensis TaxID=2782006 RepID=UPI001F39EFE2|nr:phosphoribosylanthranilate isomerase [Mongoliitalea daihaiensis]UJP63844.1 phosphoribosylanthranilate isomerase [Mongoliitalea daihaiensis]